MKNKFAHLGLVAALVGLPLTLTAAVAGSIQIIAPSTSKIEVIRSETSPSIQNMYEEKAATQIKPASKIVEIEVKAKPAKAVLVMPKMRTGEIELPIIPISQVTSK